MDMLEVALDPATVVVAVDPGKVMNRVWVSNGAGLLEEPVSLPVARSGIAALEKMLAAHAGGQVIAPVIAIEATGSLHRAWAAELERLHPGALRLFAPSETKAARTQLGSGRFKTDDRDCAALTYLARQGAGRRQAERRWSRSCVPRSGIAVGWSRTGRRPSNGSTTSSTCSARDCPPRPVTAGRCRSRPRPARRCSPARSRSPGGRPRRAH